MKIILSRKGFDSSTGGVPSPIFPDGKLLSLPIPDKKSSQVAYSEIAGNQWAGIGELVQQLAKIPPTHRAHLDPDLRFSSLPRKKGWKPIFGQTGSAESHLRNQHVDTGDVFLYFGWFRHVEKVNSEWRYRRDSKPMHALFGWLQIGFRIIVSEWPATERWAHYHPHFMREKDPRNVLYVSRDWLTIPGCKTKDIPAAGTFESISQQLILTAPESTNPSRWLLPEWFHPGSRPSALSYHKAHSRWSRDERGTVLSSAGRGQEFVLDCDDYPEALGWLQGLFKISSTMTPCS
jgi:hypothetical protein